ncbi:glycerol dehydrogenase [Limosilactobacillus mucosae]
MIDDKLDSLSLTLARDMIERCRTEMFKVSDPLALKGVALQNFIDTIFLLASLVDGFADLDGRSVAAHTFYNAYVKIIGPQRFTHGEIVALGNLFQVTLEDNSALIKEIRSYYPQVGLPLSLSALGVTKEDQLNSLAEYMAQPDNVRM